MGGGTCLDREVNSIVLAFVFGLKLSKLMKIEVGMPSFFPAHHFLEEPIVIPSIFTSVIFRLLAQCFA